MTDKIFLDSNILVYTYSNSEPLKQKISQKLIIESQTFISTQVLQELCNVITRKFKFSYADALTAVDECIQNNIVHLNAESTILKACFIADKYSFSFYDSLIISAALESECSVVYSEDMHDGQMIEGALTIKNPFK